MAAGTLGCGGFLGPRRIGKRGMPEVKETPAVRCRKSLAIFDCHIHAVKFPVEISAARWFSARAVGKGRIENARQFLDEDGSFWKGTCLEVHVQVSLFDVDMVVFGEARLAVVKGIGCQGSADKDPVAIALRQLQRSIGIKHSC